MGQLRADAGVDSVEARAVSLDVLWVHNSPKNTRMFLWDVLDALPPQVQVQDLSVPLRPRIGTMLAAIRQIRAASRSVDLVHAQYGSLVGFLSAFTSKPYVLSLRGTDFYVLPSTTVRGWIEGRLRQLFTYIACLRADLIVVMSGRMKRELGRWPFLRGKRVVTVVDPVGSEFVNDAGSSPSTLFQAEPFRVLVGSLESSNPVKRAWLVERAAELCAASGLPVSLKVLSGVPRSEVRTEMLASDLVALTSTHEGWPNIIKEGLASGLPFISTDVSDLADLCGPGTGNRIVDANALDVALAILDGLARREHRIAEAEILGSVVGVKHLLLYRHVTEAPR